MKLNWGIGIAALYLGFVAMILTLVFKASSHEVQLVTENYYEKDLQYNQHLRKLDNNATLKSELTIRYLPQENQILIQFPTETDAPVGNIQLFRPSDYHQDQSIAITTDAVRQQRIDTKELSEGKWSVKIDWQAGGKTYYKESMIFIKSSI